MTVIVDSSPIIALQRVGLLELLPRLYGSEILIPPGVRDEIEDEGRMRVSDHSFLRVVPSPPSLAMPAKLHTGEREAIALAASRPDCLLLMDERDGRRFAAMMGITVLGTGGLLVDAKRAGLIPSARSVLDALIASGFRVGASTRAALLRLASESE